MTAPSASSRLILVPGLGADQRLLEPQRVAFPHLEVPKWIPPLPHESLPSYAKRLAETHFSETPTVPLYLGGVSFGGMLSLEMAKVVPPKAVFLIASSFRGQSLRAKRSIDRWLLNTMPRPVFLWIKKYLAPRAQHRLGEMGEAHKRLCLDMLNEVDVDFFTWAAKAILNWEFEGTLSCPVYVIHGDKDVIIPLTRVKADLTVPGAGHVINLTHAAAVNAFLREKMA